MKALPVSRFLIFSALLLCCGLLGLRGYTLLTQTAPVTPSSQAESIATNLLETVVGPDQVRVTINPAGTDSYLVLLNGPEGPVDSHLRDKIVDILAAANGYSADSDRLSIQQYEFATSWRSGLQSHAALDLIGLALLAGLLMMAVMWPRSQIHPLMHAETRSAGSDAPNTVLMTSQKSADTDRSVPHLQAIRAAEANPEQAVTLIRRWMSGQEEVH